MGCGGSTEENTKHGSHKHRSTTDVNNDLTTRGNSGEGRRPRPLGGLGPHDGSGDNFAADTGGDVENPFAAPNNNSSQRAKISPHGSKKPGSPQSRPGSQGRRPTSGARRDSSNPLGRRQSLSLENNSKSGSRRTSKSQGIDGLGQMQDVQPGNESGTGVSSNTGAPPTSALPFHPRSRVLPRKFNSRHDRHYKGQYKNTTNPEWRILRPQDRPQAQANESNRVQVWDPSASEDVVATPLSGTGLPWPVVGTNWKHLKFSSKDHHVVGDHQTGDEEDDDLVPMTALVDLPPAEKDSDFLNGKRLKRTKQQILDTLVKVEDMKLHDAEIVNIAPLTHDVAVSCCRIGWMRLTSVFVALTALVVDYQLLLSRPAGFLRALHTSAARHFEDEFMLDVGFRLPIDPETGDSLLETLKDDVDDPIVESHEILSAFVEYLKGRFKSDIQYCVVVARALVAEDVDTRVLSPRGLVIEDRGGGVGTEPKITLGRKSSFFGGATA